jgi:hypothetical protein
MALGLTQSLNRNDYQEYFLGSKGGRCVGLTNLPPMAYGHIITHYDVPPILFVFHVIWKDLRSSLMMAGYCRNM